MLSYITGQSFAIDGGLTRLIQEDFMSTFVLVHGSWHDGSAWQAVVDHLEARTSSFCSHDRRTW